MGGTDGGGNWWTSGATPSSLEKTGMSPVSENLKKILQSYQGRRSLIQAAQRQKAIYTIDRFDGGLNLNKSPRDLSDWEACRMDELSPSKVGRLVRLGDFTSTTTYAMELAGVEQENYGLHYFKWSDSVNDAGTLDGGSPSNYLAYTSGDGGVDLWNFSDAGGADEVSSVVAGSKFDNTYKPVYHSADNRLYVSDANLSTTASKDKTMVCGIIDRPSYFPFTHTDGTLQYGVDAGSIESDADFYSILATSQPLYQAPPVAGITTAGNICVTTNSTGYANNGTTHQGIYMNVQFENITGDEASGTGWGATTPDDSATPSAGSKFYKFYASFLYDNGSETKLTDVTGNNNTHAEIAAFPNDEMVEAKTTSSSVYQKLVVKQVIIDVESFVAAGFKRVHGVRYYYTEVDYTSKQSIGDDKYLFAELDFRYGLKLMSEFGNWNYFENEDASGTTPTVTELRSLQILNAANNADVDIDDAGTLAIPSPPTAFTYYTLNLFHQEELKDDLMWKTSTVGNGIAFVGNLKYDGREYPEIMLYSGAGENDAGSAYPMWGTFPIDSNRITIPESGGEITALKWIKNKVLQFRKHMLYIINVEDVLAPRMDGVHREMGVNGQYAVTEFPHGIAWVNDNGVYVYIAASGKVDSLTAGRIDVEDFQAGSPHANTKIGYDDKAKMLIVCNYTKGVTNDANGYSYAYSFITDAWCTWDTNNQYTPMSNLAIDHDGYLTGGIRSSGNLIVSKWSATAQSARAIEYITKDIDMGKPNLDKRLYTLYISYTGGDGQSSMYVYFRVNGMEGADISTGWTKIDTIQDYTNPYGSNSGVSWATTGSPTTGDAYVPTPVDDLDSTDTGDVQKLAKINFRNLVSSSGNIDDTDTDGTLPQDYLKFARSIQFKIAGTADENFEINDISLIYKEKRIK